MGRRKKQRSIQKQIDAFHQAVDFAGVTLPHQLKHWERFFVNEENFLRAAQQWLSMKLQGRHMRIEDDIDKGRMIHRPYVPPTPQPVVNHPKPQWWFQEEDYEPWWKRHKPAAPVIREPEGLSGAMLVAL